MKKAATLAALWLLPHVVNGLAKRQSRKWRT